MLPAVVRRTAADHFVKKAHLLLVDLAGVALFKTVEEASFALRQEPTGDAADGTA